jgi:hypothetical protein
VNSAWPVADAVFVLQAARSAIVGEQVGRVTIYMGAVSGVLIAFGFLAQAAGDGAGAGVQSVVGPRALIAAGSPGAGAVSGLLTFTAFRVPLAFEDVR